MTNKPNSPNEEKTGKIALAAALLLKEKCKRDPLYFLTHFVKTVKEHREDDEEAIQLFPKLPYVSPIVQAWMKEPILHIAKSRQMKMSWLCQALLLWEALFYDFRLCIIINKTLEDSIRGVDRIKIIYSNLPEWMQRLCPLDKKFRDMSRESLSLKNGSSILALAQGADKVRGLVPATALLDETVFQDDAENTYGACVPCCKRIVCVSSAGPGFFAKMCGR